VAAASAFADAQIALCSESCRHPSRRAIALEVLRRVISIQVSNVFKPAVWVLRSVGLKIRPYGGNRIILRSIKIPRKALKGIGEIRYLRGFAAHSEEASLDQSAM
jgi:hypothetical protein